MDEQTIKAFAAELRQMRVWERRDEMRDFLEVLQRETSFCWECGCDSGPYGFCHCKNDE